MSSYSTHLFLLPRSPLNLITISCLPSSFFSSTTTPTYQFPNNLFHGVWLFGAKDKRFNFDLGLKCCAMSKSHTKEVFQNGGPVIKLPTIVEDDIVKEATTKVSTNEIKERIESIKSKLVSLEDGEISISAYDTAWVALVEDINGNGKPQFPSSLVWICNNQLPDGSWGDSQIFSAHDRLINTLACVIALKSWNLNTEKCHKGMKFFKENLSKLENENAEHMPIGFEVAFPSLLEIARKLNLQVPEDSTVLKEIYAHREVKLTRIPREIMHKVPTTLLHSLEGMEGLEWEKLLKLQSQDGSFLFSPSSTAFALIQTKDENCLKYLSNAVNKFNGGVPNVYPVDLFEHIWIPDRLQRLGISRFFESEIKECLSYVYRYWNEKGICWARNSDVHDIDDTAMGFRLLRLHGYKVSPDVFQQFKKGEEFICFAGQSTPAVTGMFNLYRASQALFPGETILEEAKEFSYKFLRDKQASNELLDKWIITKDLPGEVGYALEVPWYASLPRVETRFYIEQYGGQNDVWIGKTLYRMPYVNNNEYLELAKLDYDNCQALHLIEWKDMQKWYTENKLENYGLSKKSLLLAYFLATSSIFEPEKANERLAWAKTASLIETIASYFGDYEHRTSFVREFRNTTNLQNYVNLSRKSKVMNMGYGLVETLVGTLNLLSRGILVTYGRDISLHLYQAWEKWLENWQDEGDSHKEEAELLVQTINLSASRTLLEEEDVFSDTKYDRLFDLTNNLCSGLRRYQYQKDKVHNGNYSISKSKGRNTNPEIELKMQELVQLMLQNSSEDGIDSQIKQTFLTVVKTFYYAAYCDPGTINDHIVSVLFNRLMD